MPPSAAVDAYMAALPEERRPAMEMLRATIRATAPEADEVISYKMPAYKVGGRFLVSFDAFKAHYSLFPASDVVVAALGAEIAPFLAGRGTIRFPASAPIPADLVRRVVEARLGELGAALG